MATPALLTGPAAKDRYRTAQEFFLARWFELATGDDDWTLSRPFVLLRKLDHWLLMGRPGRAQIRPGGLGPWQEVDGLTLRIFDLTQNTAGLQALTYDFTTPYSREQLEPLLFGEETEAHAAFEDFIRRSERWRSYPRERILNMLTAMTRELLRDEINEAA